MLSTTVALIVAVPPGDMVVVAVVTSIAAGVEVVVPGTIPDPRMPTSLLLLDRQPIERESTESRQIMIALYLIFIIGLRTREWGI
jgi:hypothetical protein